ncbi:hypothetical protein GEOBRER4_n1828 [Citrifermentans bremense]|uniref:Uncharacterized protein n=1 Tax=Citrifermentans bremense TaxID=60035 RepID=A0A7R7IYN1_9BACT|nr:hypothetical protein GEOBRER4_n1828 [Citrifermentans bremense]
MSLPWRWRVREGGFTLSGEKTRRQALLEQGHLLNFQENR